MTSAPRPKTWSRGDIGCLSIAVPTAVWALAMSAAGAHCDDLQTAPWGATAMRTDAHNMGPEERRFVLEQRRAIVARQLRRLASELTNLDRQLHEIVQSER
jgi:hypothetical protein